MIFAAFWLPVIHFGLTTLILCRAAVTEDAANISGSERIDYLTKTMVDKLLTGYTRQNSPNGDSPTEVYIGIYIIGFYSISEATMDYALTVYLRLQWTDPRLRFNASQAGGRNKIKLGENIWERIWVPDVFLRNEKKADFHSATIPNRLMNLESNGQIWYVIKLSMTLACDMDLKKYPLDTQHCPMMFESFGHTMETVIFKWLQPPKEPVEWPQDLMMPQFKIQGIHRKSCDQNYTTGAYPCLQITFELKREFGYFFIQIYIPTVLIVILSWFAFWLNIEAVPARVSLGLLTVLTITTQASGSKSSLPRVSYIKAVDVWMSVCLGFVFASLLEFAIVNVYSRRDGGVELGRKLLPHSSPRRSPASSPGQPTLQSKRRVRGRQRKQPRQLQTSRCTRPPSTLPLGAEAGATGAAEVDVSRPRDTIVTIESESFAPRSRLLPAPSNDAAADSLTSSAAFESAVNSSPPQPPIISGPDMARRIDKFSRRMFPLSFLLFNVVYWVYYLIIA